MEKLISLGCCQFIDDNASVPETQRRHRHDVMACMERDRQMRLLIHEGNRFLDQEGNKEREEGIFGNSISQGETDGPALDGTELFSVQDITERLSALEQAVLQKNTVVEKLYLQLARKREHRYVVEICSRYLQAAVTDVTQPIPQEQALEEGTATPLAAIAMKTAQPNQILHICGTIAQERSEKLRTVLFRASRGIIMTHMTPLTELLYDPVTKTKAIYLHYRVRTRV
jgi:hypothetical protein